MRKFIAFVALAGPALAFQGIHPSEDEHQLGLSDDMGFSDLGYSGVNSFIGWSMSSGHNHGQGQIGGANSLRDPTAGGTDHSSTPIVQPPHIVRREMCRNARLSTSFDPQNPGARIGHLHYSSSFSDPGEFGVCYPDDARATFYVGQAENGKLRAFHRTTPRNANGFYKSYCDLSVTHCLSLEEWGGSRSNTECGSWGRSNPNIDNSFDSEYLRWTGCIAQCRSLLIDTDECKPNGFEFHDNLQLPNGADCDTQHTNCDSDESCFECASGYCNPQSECGRRVIRFGGYPLPIPDGIDPELVYAILQDGSTTVWQKLSQIRNLEPVTTSTFAPVVSAIAQSQGADWRNVDRNDLPSGGGFGKGPL